MRSTAVVFVCCVFLCMLTVVVSIGEREQRHRAERAEARADSLDVVAAHAKSDAGLYRLLAKANQRIVFVDGNADPQGVRAALDRDSLAHLADSLRDRRNYWYWRAHAKGSGR